MVWIQLSRTHFEIREVGLLSKCKWMQMVLASNIHCITACLTGRQLATTKVDWERSSACVSDTAPPSHRLVLVLPPGQDASRSSVEWNACHRPKSSAVPTVRLPFPPSLVPPSLVVRFFHRERRKPARPTYREEAPAPSTSQFLTGGGREQTFRGCPSLAARRS